MLKNLKITTRLTATLALLMSMLMGVIALAVWEMGQMRASAEELTRNWMPSIALVNAMNTNTSDFRVGEYAHVVSTADADMARFEAQIAAVKAEFDKNHDAYIKLISSDEERRLHDSFAADWKTYLGMHARMIEASRKNETERASAMLDGEGKQLFDKLSATLTKLVDLNNAGGEAETRKAEEAYADARNAMLAILLFAVVAATVAGVWLVRSIAGPLAQAVAAADRVAAGDFTHAVAADGEDEAAQVLKALARMQSNLAQVVVSVRANSESVATASAQIAQGNLDLSQRTEEQASALQQTAATMEQLSSTVRNNTDNARQANQLAQTATAVAAQGGEVVGQVVSTMQGISESSRRIGDIIGVIDGIAFQTNILALNAAVEAARAGEQGRGFAVVAGEVRTLAQRSAEAAKEIKSLISRSVEQVEQGTALVDTAGKTMGEIVGSIKRVNDIVTEITAASVQQAAGVSQAGDAVSQMDQVTQQNAALVEESAAAATSLKNQAQQLVDVVAVFKVPNERAVPATDSVVPVGPASVAPRRSSVGAASGGRQSRHAGAAAKPAHPMTARAEAEDWVAF